MNARVSATATRGRELADGSEDMVRIDAVLEYNRDPDHLTELQG